MELLGAGCDDSDDDVTASEHSALSVAVSPVGSLHDVSLQNDDAAADATFTEERFLRASPPPSAIDTRYTTFHNHIFIPFIKLL